MISLALPKGSLEAQTLQLFKEADLEVRRTDRDYSPRISDARIGKIKILRPQEIPNYVEMGYFDVGISGLDWVKETGARVREVANLSYSKTGEGNVKIVIAVHQNEDISRGDRSDEQQGHHRISGTDPRILRLARDSVQLFHSYGRLSQGAGSWMFVVDLTEQARRSGRTV